MTINRTSVNFGIVEGEFGLNQCFGRIIWSDPDPDPYQEALIWIRVAPKINQNHGINKSKWFVNVLFT